MKMIIKALSKIDPNVEPFNILIQMQGSEVNPSRNKNQIFSQLQ